MRRRIRKKLFYQLIAYHTIPLVLITVIGLGGILSWSNYLFFKSNIKQNYTHILTSAAGEIKLFMAKARTGLESLSSVMAAGNLDEWHRKMALAAFLSKNEEFESLTLVSPTGETSATTQVEGESPVFLDKETFIQALTGKPAVSQVMISAGSIPYIHVAAPLIRLGETDGVLWGYLNLKSMWDVLSGITVGKTGQVYIMDTSGRYVGHPDIAQVIRGFGSGRPDILEKLRGGDGAVFWTEEKDGKCLISLGVYIESLDWVVAMEQEIPEIYSFLYLNFFWALGIMLAALALGIGFGWRRMRLMVTPIRDLHANILRIGEGDIGRVVATDREDEIGDLGRAFNRMTELLQQHIHREVETARELAHARSLAQLGVASSKVTHEVKNLMGNMGMVLQILKTETLTPIGQDRLMLLEREAGHLQAFVMDFLQFARKPVLQTSFMPLNMSIREILSVHQYQADGLGISLALDWPEEIPPFNGDHRMLYQAINNLVKNSMTAVGENGAIRITGRGTSEELVMTVEDTGPGIAPEVREKIFEPFFTTKEKRGTGLGLAIVQSVIQAHGGTITCDSTSGSGTRFVIRLPIRSEFVGDKQGACL